MTSATQRPAALLDVRVATARASRALVRRVTGGPAGPSAGRPADPRGPLPAGRPFGPAEVTP